MLDTTSENVFTQMIYEVAFQKAQIAAIELKTQIAYIQQVAIAGSIRRKERNINNINIIVITPDGKIPAELPMYLNSLSLKVLSTTSFEVKAIDLEKCLYQFNFCLAQSFPCLLNYLTGPEHYIIKLRKIAKNLNYKLNSIGLFDRYSGNQIKLANEQMLYDVLGVPYDLPEQRKA